MDTENESRSTYLLVIDNTWCHDLWIMQRGTVKTYQVLALPNYKRLTWGVGLKHKATQVTGRSAKINVKLYLGGLDTWGVGNSIGLRDRTASHVYRPYDNLNPVECAEIFQVFP